LAKAIDLSFLFWIPRVFVYAALFAWAITFLGLLRTVFTDLRGFRFLDASIR
jgi:hypothetical protein